MVPCGGQKTKWVDINGSLGFRTEIKRIRWGRRVIWLVGAKVLAWVEWYIYSGGCHGGRIHGYVGRTLRVGFA